MLSSLDGLDDLHKPAKMGAMCRDNPSFVYANLEPIFHVSVAESDGEVYSVSMLPFFLQIVRIAWSLFKKRYLQMLVPIFFIEL